MVLPIEFAVVFDKGGRVLWSKTVTKLKGDPVNALISKVLLEEKGQSQSAIIDTYSLSWRLINEADTLIVVVSQRSLELDFVGELLDSMRTACLSQLKKQDFHREAFEASFRSMEVGLESRLRLRAKAASSAATPAATPAVVAAEEEEEESEEAEESVADKLKRRGAGLKGGRPGSGKSGGKKEPVGKKKTVWQNSTKKLSAKEAASLDYSKSKAPGDDESRIEALRGSTLTGEKGAWEEEDPELAVVEEDQGDDKAKKSWFSSALETVSGDSTLTAEKIEPIMEQLRSRLEAKNVAVEIASEICQSVAASIVGVKIGRFSRPKILIRDALKEAVSRVLTPGRSTDLLREVIASKGRRRGPYSIVFVGINGVGKSTTLSKVAYYLKQHGIDVQITACDTFRSGAVEQLRTHARVLDVELYEKGYLKDPSDVARASMEHARAQKRECVLIDTAGRMQNNEKLMRELAKLVTVNEPDLILFVGEALVGNDGIDQLNMFNNALKSFCANGRSIDGLVLTKFDTIDDKVGATLSMTYKTGQPIMFIGVGQKYTHLKKLSVNAVVNSLFS